MESEKFMPLVLATAMALVALMAPTTGHAALSLVLVDEDFSAGSASGTVFTSSATGPSNGQQWVWLSPDSSTTVTTHERWTGGGGASARGLNSSYDHDQNNGTPNITIPGGFEVMSDPNTPTGTVRVALQFTLPSYTTFLGTNNGELSFFAANRISGGLGGNAPRVGLYNLTDDREILPLTALNYPGGNSNWNFKLYDLDFLESDLGDLLELRFQDSVTSGGGIGARGLQVADVQLFVSIPEPSIPLLLGFSALALVARRRRACPSLHPSS